MFLTGFIRDLKADMTVLIDGETIVEVGHKTQIAIPDHFFSIDMSGRTIMPRMDRRSRAFVLPIHI
jgi:imidazolonepropionase-like amidohydrolase